MTHNSKKFISFDLTTNMYVDIETEKFEMKSMFRKNLRIKCSFHGRKKKVGTKRFNQH